MNITRPIAIAGILIIIGIVFFVLMFFHPISEIALAVAGAGFLAAGFIQLAAYYITEQNRKNSEQLMARLDEIKEELKKEEPKKGDVAIADVIASGMKYYSEYMGKSDKEEKKE
jgi:hypothetical protein